MTWDPGTQIVLQTLVTKTQFENNSYQRFVVESEVREGFAFRFKIEELARFN